MGVASDLRTNSLLVTRTVYFNVYIEYTSVYVVVRYLTVDLFLL